MRKAVFCNPVYNATHQQGWKQGQPFLWCWMLLLGRLESQLGSEGSKAVTSATYSVVAAEKGSSLNCGQYVFFLPFCFPSTPQLRKTTMSLLSEKVLFSFAAHRTGEEALHIWYFIPDTFTPLQFLFRCFIFLKAFQSKIWGSNDGGGGREKESSLFFLFFATYVSLMNMVWVSVSLSTVVWSKCFKFESSGG